MGADSCNVTIGKILVLPRAFIATLAAVFLGSVWLSQTQGAMVFSLSLNLHLLGLSLGVSLIHVKHIFQVSEEDVVFHNMERYIIETGTEIEIVGGVLKILSLKKMKDEMTFIKNVLCFIKVHMNQQTMIMITMIN